jgi:AcrR family transcriptional regulator
MSAARGRPAGSLRADARRNHDRVLRAADAVFAAEGAAASTGRVADRAGVSVGTVFRHFPTKAALLDTVVGRRVERLAGAAERLAAADDPGAAFDRFFRRVGLQAATCRALAEAFAGDCDAAPEARARFAQAVEVLLARAQAAGAVRSDVHVADLVRVLAGVTPPAERPDVGAPTLSGALDEMLRHLRPPPGARARRDRAGPPG